MNGPPALLEIFARRIEAVARLSICPAARRRAVQVRVQVRNFQPTSASRAARRARRRIAGFPRRRRLRPAAAAIFAGVLPTLASGLNIDTSSSPTRRPSAEQERTPPSARAIWDTRATFATSSPPLLAERQFEGLPPKRRREGHGDGAGRRRPVDVSPTRCHRQARP